MRNFYFILSLVLAMLPHSGGLFGGEGEYANRYSHKFEAGEASIRGEQLKKGREADATKSELDALYSAKSEDGQVMAAQRAGRQQAAVSVDKTKRTAEQMFAALSDSKLYPEAKAILAENLITFKLPGQRKDFFKPLLDKYGAGIFKLFLSHDVNSDQRERMLSFLRSIVSAEDLASLFSEHLSAKLPLSISNAFAFDAMASLGEANKPHLDKFRAILEASLSKEGAKAITSSSVAASAVKAIGSLGKSGSPALGELNALIAKNLDSRWDTAKANAVAAIGKIGGPDSLRKLSHLAVPGQPSAVQDAVLEALSSLPNDFQLDAETAKNLRLATGSEEADVVSKAFQVFAKVSNGIEAEKTAKYFIGKLSPDSDVFQRAYSIENYAQAVSRLPKDHSLRKQGQASLGRALGDPSPAIRKRAVRALHESTELEDPAIETLLATKKSDPSIDVRLEVALAQYRRGGKPPYEELREGLNHPKAMDRTLEIMDSLDFSAVSGDEFLKIFQGKSIEEWSEKQRSLLGSAIKKWILTAPVQSLKLSATFLRQAVKAIRNEDDLLPFSNFKTLFNDPEALALLMNSAKSHPHPEPLMAGLESNLKDSLLAGKSLGELEPVIGFLIQSGIKGWPFLKPVIGRYQEDLDSVILGNGQAGEDYANYLITTHLKSSDRDFARKWGLMQGLRNRVNADAAASPEIEKEIVANFGKNQGDYDVEAAISTYVGRAATRDKNLKEKLLKDFTDKNIANRENHSLDIALLAMGSEAIPHIKKDLASSIPALQLGTLKSLEALRSEEIEKLVPEIVKILDKSPAEINAQHSADFQRQLKEKGSASQIYLDSSELRLAALSRLGGLVHPSNKTMALVEPRVLNTLKESTNPDELIQGIHVLGNFIPEKPDYIKPIAEKLHADSPQITYAAADALMHSREGNAVLVAEFAKLAKPVQQLVGEHLAETQRLFDRRLTPDLEKLIRSYKKTDQPSIW